MQIVLVTSFDESNYDPSEVAFHTYSGEFTRLLDMGSSYSENLAKHLSGRSLGDYRQDCKYIADDRFTVVVYRQCDAQGHEKWRKEFWPTNVPESWVGPVRVKVRKFLETVPTYTPKPPLERSVKLQKDPGSPWFGLTLKLCLLLLLIFLFIRFLLG